MTPRTRSVLIGLAVAAGLLVLLRRDRDAVPAVAARADQDEDQGRRRTREIDAEDVPLVVTLLGEPHEGESFERERSLFAYARSPDEIRAEEDAKRKLEEQAQKAAAERAAQLEEQRKADEERRKRDAEIAAARAQEEAAERQRNPPKPTPPGFEYQFVGLIGPMEGPYAILVGKDAKNTYAKAGDVIESKFRIERVGQLRLDLSYTQPPFEGDVHQVPRTFPAPGGRGR